MAEKSKDAFRTISEVADWLDVPTHVLRFWESRFSQIKPVKRAGGRRYYRPSDMRVIGGVKVLLHDQGMTIRGVQKLFREEGIKHVSGFSPDLFDGNDQTDVPVSETTLEEAARPAPSARATHAAAPDPVDDTSDGGGETDAAPVFRRAQTPPASPAEPHPAPAAIVAPADVPDTDPMDDDSAHAKTAGVAARLRMASRSDLDAHRTTLEEAATRLRAILDKAS